MKHPCRQAVLDALKEIRSESLPRKISAAERAISARLCDPNLTDRDEIDALQDALRTLHILSPESEHEKEPGKKKDTA